MEESKDKGLIGCSVGDEDASEAVSGFGSVVDAYSASSVHLQEERHQCSELGGDGNGNLVEPGRDDVLGVFESRGE